MDVHELVIRPGRGSATHKEMYADMVGKNNEKMLCIK